MKKICTKNYWKTIGVYWMYYIDYYLSTLWNIFRIWVVVSFVLFLIILPPVLWKVHAFLYAIAQGHPLTTALIKSKQAIRPDWENTQK